LLVEHLALLCILLYYTIHINIHYTNLTFVSPTEHSELLVEHLSSGIAAPEVVGVDWRLDYSVKSRKGGRENVAMFYVSLTVKDRGLLREVLTHIYIHTNIYILIYCTHTITILHYHTYRWA
jgi:hypothetical protein